MIPICAAREKQFLRLHPRLQRHVKHRLGALEAGTGLNWATAEVCRLSRYKFLTSSDRYSDLRLWRLARSFKKAMTSGYLVKMSGMAPSVRGGFYSLSIPVHPCHPFSCHILSPPS